MAKLAARIRSASAPSLGGAIPSSPPLMAPPLSTTARLPVAHPWTSGAGGPWTASIVTEEPSNRATPLHSGETSGCTSTASVTGTGLDPYRSLAVDDRGGEHRSPTPGDGDTKLIPTDPEIRGERSRPDAGLLERARGADDERRCQRHIVKFGGEVGR